MNRNQAYLIGADMIVRSNRDLGNVIARSNREYAQKLEEISKAEIKSKDRVDITLEQYEAMKDEIESLTYEVERLRNILVRIDIPIHLNIIPDSIETSYCKDHLNYKRIFDIRFAVDEGEMHRNGYY